MPRLSPQAAAIRAVCRSSRAADRRQWKSAQNTANHAFDSTVEILCFHHDFTLWAEEAFPGVLVGAKTGAHPQRWSLRFVPSAYSRTCGGGCGRRLVDAGSRHCARCGGAAASLKRAHSDDDGLLRLGAALRQRGGRYSNLSQIETGSRELI